MELQKIDTAGAMPAITCDLFNVSHGFRGTTGKGGTQGRGNTLPARTASERECGAYADFLRRRDNLPEYGACKLQWRSTGRGASAHRQCVGATYSAKNDPTFEHGGYSILFPGANQRQVVTMETLSEAGEVVTSQTLPIEPKKGGIIWKAADVKAAHGPKGTPIPCSTEEIEAPAQYKGCHHAAGVAAFGEGKPRELPSYFTKPRNHNAKAWFAGWDEAAAVAPEAVQDVEARPGALAEPLKAENAPSGPETPPVAQSAAEPDPLAAILARLEAMEAAIAERDAGPPAESVEMVDARDDPTWRVASNGAGMMRFGVARYAGREWAEGDSGKVRRFASIDAAQAAADDLNSPPTARAKRSPAHERAIRRARTERQARREAERHCDDAREVARGFWARYEEMEALRNEAKNEVLQEIGKAMVVRAKRRYFAKRARRMIAAERARSKALNAKRRANALFARKRTKEMVAAVNHMHHRLDAAKADTAQLRRDMADPSQPERESDIARLVKERDEARNANAALQQRCQRMEAASLQGAEAIEGLVSRLSRAEARLRELDRAA